VILRFNLVFAAALALASGSAAAQTMQDMPGMQMPAQREPQTPPPPPPPAQGHDDHRGMQMDMAGMDMGEPMSMSGALGDYSMNREASGTSWQPDASEHGGVHVHRGPWMLMGHMTLNGVYDWQGGPRGDEKAFISGMIMGMARRSFANGDTLNLRAMLAPDPLMGASGYPLLLQTGETANGVTPLVDRQHPHDLFMELSASYAHQLSGHNSVFVYGGLPGEPAFGPPAFMHRMSAMDSPEAPLTHHWLDSTHVTFGVITAGFVHDNWKIEASRFRGREPDQHRYDIETGALDSTAVRVSWNPNENWSLQASWADVTSPEALHPDEDERRWSVSGIYTHPVGAHGWYSATAAFGRKERSDGVTLDAWLAEAALHPNDRWTLFARGESLENDELAPGPARDVGRLSIGAIRDWRLSEHTVFGVGALFEHTLIPTGLEADYSNDPNGAMGFVRLKIG
jgi:hypothetical protein